MIKGEEIKLPGRCNMCDSSRMISANGNFSFPACFHPPYKGKWCAEIKDCPMSNNEKRYWANIARERCGYWDVCEDHACRCSPSAAVSRGFNEQVYESMRLQRLQEAEEEFWYEN